MDKNDYKIFNYKNFCSLGYRLFASSIQGQIAMLSRLLVMRQQQEQEQIPESPSPSPGPSTTASQRANTSRSRHSSVSHGSGTTQQDIHQQEHETSTNIESSLRGSHSSLGEFEPVLPQSNCAIS